MHKTEKNDKKAIESEKITLQGYYDRLPKSESPKTLFLNDIVRRAHVSLNTARNWAVYGMRPKNAEHVRLLSEMTGIPEENLFRR